LYFGKKKMVNGNCLEIFSIQTYLLHHQNEFVK
jgi:hypothetical protein